MWAALCITCVVGWHTRPRSPIAWVDELNLDGRGRLLDVGCGPGSLILLLAAHFEQVVGVDADEQMLAEGERQAAAAGITNIEWVHGKGEELSPDLGHFRVATMA